MIGSVFVVMCILTTIISIILGILTKHRGWCAICPMGFLQEKIGKINRESSHAHSGGAFYRFLAHLGFGLVTYLPLIFFAVDLFIRRGSDMKGAIATAFSFSAYTLVLGTLGWKFAVPALIIAGIGLSKVKCLKLNVATVAISIIILLWNFLSVTIGG